SDIVARKQFALSGYPTKAKLMHHYMLGRFFSDVAAKMTLWFERVNSAMGERLDEEGCVITNIRTDIKKYSGRRNQTRKHSSHEMGFLALTVVKIMDSLSKMPQHMQGKSVDSQTERVKKPRGPIYWYNPAK
ncbi:MAG: hypothetical protein HQM09_17685, partial [Candidatus Riflebacteria bacterium]|nr:hypothetical protein [Candidatus Riflebacteria bacterium]